MVTLSRPARASSPMAMPSPAASSRSALEGAPAQLGDVVADERGRHHAEVREHRVPAADVGRVGEATVKAALGGQRGQGGARVGDRRVARRVGQLRPGVGQQRVGLEGRARLRRHQHEGVGQVERRRPSRGGWCRTPPGVGGRGPGRPASRWRRGRPRAPPAPARSHPCRAAPRWTARCPPPTPRGRRPRPPCAGGRRATPAGSPTRCPSGHSPASRVEQARHQGAGVVDHRTRPQLPADRALALSESFWMSSSKDLVKLATPSSSRVRATSAMSTPAASMRSSAPARRVGVGVDGAGQRAVVEEGGDGVVGHGVHRVGTDEGVDVERGRDRRGSWSRSTPTGVAAPWPPWPPAPPSAARRTARRRARRHAAPGPPRRVPRSARISAARPGRLGGQGVEAPVDLGVDPAHEERRHAAHRRRGR